METEYGYIWIPKQNLGRIIELVKEITQLNTSEDSLNKEKTKEIASIVYENFGIKSWDCLQRQSSWWIYIGMTESEQDDDGNIISRVVSGRREDFGLLVRRYQHVVVRMAANLLGDDHEAQDISQQAFIDAYRNLKRYDSARGTFMTWLLRLARNRCLKAMRKKRPATLEFIPERPDTSLPEDNQRLAEMQLTLNSALAEMPDDMRRAFVLVAITGLNCSCAAKVEGVPQGTLRSRLSRARQHLRGAMDTYMERDHDH